MRCVIVRCAGVFFALALALAPRLARAQQCGTRVSSCFTCHETQALHAVRSDGTPWHGDHAFADFCRPCHGGDAAAPDARGAHAGLVAPLADDRATCRPCHEQDHAAMAQRYAERLHARTSPPRAASPAAPGTGARRASLADLVLAAIAVLLALAGVALVRANEQRLAAAPRPPVTTSPPRPGLLRRPWSPYVAGAGLGLVAAISLAVFGHRLGASGGIDSLAAFLGARLRPGSLYYSFVVQPHLGWQPTLLAGLFAGSMSSSLAGGTLRARWLPEREWIEAFGPSRAKRLALAFLGAALVQFAAGVAGGCTSGLAVSGGVLMAPSAYLFMAAMFAGGMPTAYLVHRHRRRQP